MICLLHFYPRSPCGERQDVKYKRDQTILFLSTLSLRRATMFVNLRVLDGSISIHALLAESDWKPIWTHIKLFIFLSTLSVRRATQSMQKAMNMPRFLSMLSLRRATKSLFRCRQALYISIHALLAESDSVKWQFKRYIIISIHALLAESDYPASCRIRK